MKKRDKKGRFVNETLKEREERRKVDMDVINALFPTEPKWTIPRPETDEEWHDVLNKMEMVLDAVREWKIKLVEIEKILGG